MRWGFGEALRRDASVWFAGLQRADAQRYRLEFERWRAADPAYRLAYERLGGIWQASGRDRPAALMVAGAGIFGRRDACLELRPETPRITGLPERSARPVLKALVEEGVLASTTEKDRCRRALPAHRLDVLFPRLYPEGI